jgi:hypothetical protein
MSNPIKDIFSGKYVVENKLVNYAGGQLFRYLGARIIYHLRGVVFGWVSDPDSEDLKREGIIKIESFLGEDDYRKLLEEFEQTKKVGKYQPIQDGSTRSERYTMEIADLEKLPTLNAKIVNSPVVKALVESGEHRSYEVDKYIWCDEVVNGDPAKGADSQKELHVDNFFTTHKIWYFFDPVTVEDGPLVYVKRSHRMGIKRAIFEYVNSVRFDTIKSHAFRVTPAWLKFIKPDTQSCLVQGNTLVIANTMGYHRRGDAVPGRVRRQIHYRVRFNPFKNILKR